MHGPPQVTIWGFIFMKVSFLIDGFNLYHSLKPASYTLKLNGSGTRWLDLKALCQNYLHLFGKDAVLSEIYYFTALATHIKGDTVAKHQKYIQCLQDSDVTVVLGSFKAKTFNCIHCGNEITRHEEKETDVAISAKLLELLALNSCDAVVLVTGDTDLAAGIKVAKRLYPTKQIGCMFPFGRKNKELVALADKQFKVSAKVYTQCQFPDPVSLKTGQTVDKPQGW